MAIPVACVGPHGFGRRMGDGKLSIADASPRARNDPDEPLAARGGLAEVYRLKAWSEA